MDNPNLYIIAGCNGAGKTTASMTVLPEVLECEEFVNADEIAKGLSPFHPEEMAIEAGKPSPEMAEMRVASRVASGGHNIPKDVIHRRYWLGLQNLFEIFAPIVDYWSFFDNSFDQDPIVVSSEIINPNKLSKIKELCQSRKK